MKLLMISAMYENGGNVTHRHLDGHPQLHVYPFESQIGTKYVSDELLSMFPFKYRWPEFPLEGNLEDDFELFFDEEYKTRVRNPLGSKFRGADLQVKEAERKALFIKYMAKRPRTAGNLTMAFFYASFEAWKNCRRTGREKYYVGYSPIIGVDAAKIFRDLPDAKVLHVVRSPLACFPETRRRSFPLSLNRYVWTWNFVQYRALVYRRQFPKNFIIIRYEDLLENKKKVMSQLSRQLGISFNESMLTPSWNGRVLDNVYPWGTIDFPDKAEQQRRQRELSKGEITQIKEISRIFLKELGYSA